MRVTIVHGMVILAILLITPPSVLARKIKEGPDPYLHKLTWILFPARIGSFLKQNTYHHNEDGSSVSVNYSTEGESPLLIAVSVYPLEPVEMQLADPDLVPQGWRREDFIRFVTLEVNFAEALSGISRRNPNLTVLEETFTERPHSKIPFMGRQADFMFRWEQGNLDLNGTILMFDYDGWVVLYRLTYPLSKFLPHVDEYKEFLEHPLWPEEWSDPEKSIFSRGFRAGLHNENLHIKRHVR